ncbi:MAG TPA: ATP-binding protein [Nitrososphaeraceae archaeon]|nr:ATP-binding protein [Nitrososphaeraceae archaeon]
MRDENIVNMTIALKVHPSFFKEFATKTWVSPADVIKELIENAFDEDATRVLITILNDNSISIEDNAGMDESEIQKFLLLGSPHKKLDSISPKFKRIRTGRYGTGRLSFLTSFEKMKIRTRKGNYHKSFLIDTGSLDALFTGKSNLREIRESRLSRDGTEIMVSDAKSLVDELRLIKEIRKLAVLRHPLFEVYIKKSGKFKEWNFTNSELIRVPDIQGHKIPLNLDKGNIVGEITVARRPLTEDERGIAVMVGGHIVMRTLFGYDTKIPRVTGFVRCDSLTSRFADKSAIIEDKEFERFSSEMKKFIIDTVIPSLTLYEDVLVTREESKIYKQIDKVLGQAVIETLEPFEEIEGYEIVETKKVVSRPSKKTSAIPAEDNLFDKSVDEEYKDFTKENKRSRDTLGEKGAIQQTGGIEDNTLPNYLDSNQNIDNNYENVTVTTQIKKPLIKKTFALKKIGYKIIPYEDETDSRYSFINENVVFVNKANPTYKAESSRGDEFLLRHIMNIVAQAVAESRHPEGKEALELQNRLVSEAIRIHDTFLSKTL